jgi:hypothetical protein
MAGRTGGGVGDAAHALRWRDNPAGAAPARVVRSHVPGRLRDPPWGHHDPCARSSLTAPISSPGRNARTGAEASLSGDAQSRDGAPAGATCLPGHVHFMKAAPAGAPSPSLLPRGRFARDARSRRGAREQTPGAGRGNDQSRLQGLACIARLLCSAKVRRGKPRS